MAQVAHARQRSGGDFRLRSAPPAAWGADAIRYKNGKASGNLLVALDTLFAQPIITAHSLADAMGTTYETANKITSKLCDLGVLVEMTGYKRNRRFFDGDPPGRTQSED